VLANLQDGTATDLNDGDSFIGHDTFSGIDVFRASNFDDVVYGSDSDGVEIRGELGNDLIIGGSGAEYLDGDDRKGNATFSSDDTLVGGAGNDTLDGNNGNDTVVYAAESGSNGVIANLAIGTATDTFRDTDTLIGIENLIGTSHDDTLISDAGSNWLFGGDGNDILDGGSNPETHDGTGVLTGGVGDVMAGGAGDDTYYVDSPLDYVLGGTTNGLGSGNDTVVSSASFFADDFSSARTLTVSSTLGSDTVATLIGSSIDNDLIGHSGSDFLFGYGGSDTYRGGDGIDYLVLDDYGLGHGNNTVIVDPRTSGATSWDVVYGFDTAKDKVDVSHYQDPNGAPQYASGDDVLAHTYDDGAGNSYALLGDGADVLYFAGLTKADLHADDFTV
jgi:Ca2+-binding RTX toxin-like protein